jgi:hypothetical protein
MAGPVEKFVDSVSSAIGGVSLDANKFRSAVLMVIATWVVRNVFLNPAKWLFGGLEWAYGSLYAGIDSAIRSALGSAGTGIWDAFLGPNGAITALQDVAVGLATSAGIGAPLAAGLVNLAMFGIVVGAIYLLARAAAGYLTGGVLS